MEFLLARIAEDEARFRTGGSDGTSGDMNADYIETLHERLLAECEAKRRIAALYDYARETGQGPGGYLEKALEALALPYADHPDYRQEWKP